MEATEEPAGDAEAAARLWLGRLGREVTPAAVAALAPHTALANDSGPAGNAWRVLVRKGRIPTPELLTATVDRAPAAVEAQAAALTADPAGAQAAQWVHDYRRDRGEGPLWAELSQAMGWEVSRPVLTAMLRQLRLAGWITFTTVTHSLDVGRTAREAFEAQAGAEPARGPGPNMTAPA